MPYVSDHMITPNKTHAELSAEETSSRIAGWLDEMKGRDVHIMQLGPDSPICDVVVLVTANSVRHAQGLADFVRERVKADNIEFLSMEGHAAGEWILLDLNDVLVHVMTQEFRELYDIEGLWADAKSIPFTPEG